MLTSLAIVETDRPGRYLVQFCRHAAAMGKAGGGHGPRLHAAGAAPAAGALQVSAEWSDTHGVVTIAPWGRCLLRAAERTLTLRVDAPDQEALERIQRIVSRTSNASVCANDWRSPGHRPKLRAQPDGRRDGPPFDGGTTIRAVIRLASPIPAP
jgi:hypothetical protein